MIRSLLAVLLAGVLAAGAGCEAPTGSEAGGTTLRDGVQKADNPPHRVRTFGPGNRGR
jgi:hypothetical protein